MSVNLTALIHDRQHNIEAVNNLGDFYTAALRAYWAGDTQKAFEEVSAGLVNYADSIDGADATTFAAYRLWIEVLAEAEEYEALTSLVAHLLARGQAETDVGAHATFAALRGMAHFALDEISAAKLIARSVADCVEDPYCLELTQLVASRFSETNNELPALCRSTVPLTDYCHWQTLARALLIHKEDEALTEVLQHVRDTYRMSPLPHLFEFHRCVEEGYYAGAALVATRLCELYPDNVDYQYYRAYALYEDGDYPMARKYLQHLVQVTGETDAEIVGLLGHCNAKLGDAEKACHYLKRAVSLLQSQGLPSSHVRLELANVEEELRGEELDPALAMPRATRMWLINLSPRRYNELRTSSENTIDRLLRPMGSEPRPGDFCFFASSAAPDSQGETQWKIAAIYAVDSEPMWHPVHRYHTALQLVARPPEGIPVAVQVLNEHQGAKKSKSGRPGHDELGPDHPYTFGVFELEMGALDIITEAVRRRNEELVGRRGDDSKKGQPHRVG